MQPLVILSPQSAGLAASLTGCRVAIAHSDGTVTPGRGVKVGTVAELGRIEAPRIWVGIPRTWARKQLGVRPADTVICPLRRFCAVTDLRHLRDKISVATAAEERSTRESAEAERRTVRARFNAQPPLFRPAWL